MTTSLLTKTAAALAAAVTMPLAWAHPGHGNDSSWFGLAHLLEAEHLLPVLAIVAVAWLARRALRRRR